MKRLFAVIVSIVLLLACVSASADAVNLKSLDNTALIDLLAFVQQEIADRHIEKSASLPEGSYIVGKDIPAGLYDITVTYKGSMWMDVYIIADGGKGDTKQDFTVFANGDYGDGTGAFHAELLDGDLLKCTAPITLTISAGVMFK